MNRIVSYSASSSPVTEATSATWNTGSTAIYKLYQDYVSTPLFTRIFVFPNVVCKYPALQHIDIPAEEAEEEQDDENDCGCRFLLLSSRFDG